ncbi:hypothetical protein [Acidovorax sp. BLS4]|uniref:hypothetical protein n=1 Tax=Acidovorax sp. BLS4 TaxID=3273430 RepID=UPI0029430EE7|nr:hypothetical protein [Paracidovorax avenae]WOI45143.1 hypothetical protein R1Z03_21900 [Paracidovorax avenae]
MLWVTNQAQAEPVRAVADAALKADAARMLGVRLSVSTAHRVQALQAQPDTYRAVIPRMRFGTDVSVGPHVGGKT